MKKKGRKIMEPKEKFQRKQRRKKIGYGILVFLAVVGLAILMGIFFAQGLASVERQKVSIAWYWYVIGGGLIVPLVSFSVWNIFWLKSIFSIMKKRGGGGEWEKIVVGKPINIGRRRL